MITIISVMFSTSMFNTNIIITISSMFNNDNDTTN